jgi:tRNA modification GTPase
MDDTIAAIATPLGEGGLAVIRVSGRKAFEIGDLVFRGKVKLREAKTHTVHYGKVVRRRCEYQSDGTTQPGYKHTHSKEEVVDEVMATVLRGPRSFTGEDTVEVSCHGGILAAKMVLDSCLAAGARLAEPGEFTRRAFLNGRIDLAQAGAVMDLIHSRTELALRAANEQLAGNLSKRINELRDRLMIVLAHVEAHIDFPDEDIAPDTKEQLLARLREGSKFVDELLRTAPEGQILRRGIRAAIVGKPNVGKSSLLNQLLGRERAIVSPTPGTTRDTIEETANIRGIPVIFIDTAGLRESTDEIEREGIRRSRETLEKAELVLHVIDQSEAQEFPEIGDPNRTILILNKSDLPARISDAEGVKISCATGSGIEELKARIEKMVWSGRVGSEMNDVMINSRHEDALRRARAGLEHTIGALQRGDSIELAAMDLRLAVGAIGEIVGKTTTEDLLDAIFSQFCLGK